MATKSVQRTLELMRNNGLMAAVVEKYNHYSGHREDLFGFLDVIALSDKEGIIGVQACGGSDWSSHLAKLTHERAIPVRYWLDAGGRLFLIGWRKLKVVKKDGTKGKADRWVPRIFEFFHDSKEGFTQAEYPLEHGYICKECAEHLGAEAKRTIATMHRSQCPQCLWIKPVNSLNDWYWPRGSKCPEV